MSRDELLEIIVVIMLGVTALFMAWASWIGSLHGGNQATNYTRSNNLAAEGNAMYNEASMMLMQDMILYNEINDLRIDLTYADDNGNTEDYERIEWKLDELYANNVSQELADAINWADEQADYASPFDKEGFIDSYFADAWPILEESEALLEQGQKDNANDDTFGLVTVVYSVILFLLGIVSSFNSTRNKTVVIIISVVAFVAVTLFMVLGIPMPTGFSLASFFGG